MRCPRCGSGGCASYHGTRSRKHVVDLTTGETHEDIPIVRVKLCDGSTRSLTPAALWRGRSTVGSVLEAVLWCHQEGTATACERLCRAGDGESVVDESTVRRWRRLVHRRLIGSALAVLGPDLGISWSDSADAVPQLQELIDRLSPPLLLAFRARYGHAVLDKPPSAQAPSPPRSAARPVPGSLDRALPHDPPSIPARQGAKSASSRPRGPRRPP